MAAATPIPVQLPRTWARRASGTALTTRCEPAPAARPRRNARAAPAPPGPQGRGEGAQAAVGSRGLRAGAVQAPGGAGPPSPPAGGRAGPQGDREAPAQAARRGAGPTSARRVGETLGAAGATRNCPEPWAAAGRGSPCIKQANKGPLAPPPPGIDPSSPAPCLCARPRPQVQGQIRALLLQRVVQEPLHAVRRAIADVVGAAARVAVPQNQWPGAAPCAARAPAAGSSQAERLRWRGKEQRAAFVWPRAGRRSKRQLASRGLRCAGGRRPHFAKRAAPPLVPARHPPQSCCSSSSSARRRRPRSTGRWQCCCLRRSWRRWVSRVTSDLRAAE